VLSAKLSLSYRPCGELRLKTRLFTSDERESVLKAQDAPLLSKALNSKSGVGNTKSTRGFGDQPNETIFTLYAKRFVEDAAAVLESLYGKQVTFTTLTLPGSTKDSSNALCAYSAYVVQRFTQWLRDNAPGSDWVFVWERQKRGALHLHAAIGNHDPIALRFIEKEVKEFWCLLLETVGRKSGVDLFARAQGGTWRNDWREVRANSKPVRESIKHYLAKYLSKNKIQRAQIRKLNEPDATFPTRWWGVTNRIRNLVKTMRRQWESPLIQIGAARAVGRRVTGFCKLFSLFNVQFGNKWRWGDATIVVRASDEKITQLLNEVRSMREFAPELKTLSRLYTKPPPQRIARAVDAWMKALDERQTRLVERTAHIDCVA